MKLTTSFKLEDAVFLTAENPPQWKPVSVDSCEHIGFPLIRTHERAAAVAFARNPDATHCIVSTKGKRDAITVARSAKSEAEWQAIRETKGT